MTGLQTPDAISIIGIGMIITIIGNKLRFKILQVVGAIVILIGISKLL